MFFISVTDGTAIHVQFICYVLLKGNADLLPVITGLSVSVYVVYWISVTYMYMC